MMLVLNGRLLHKRICLVGSALTIPLCVLMFGILDKERMPKIVIRMN